MPRHSHITSYYDNYESADGEVPALLPPHQKAPRPATAPVCGMTRRSHFLILTSILLIFALLVCIYIYQLLRARKENVQTILHTSPPLNSTTAPATLCLSRDCITAAADILNTMDPAAEPCIDFYQFACGRFTQERSVPLGATSWGHFPDQGRERSEQLVMKQLESVSGKHTWLKKPRHFYRSCVSQQLWRNLAALRTELADIRVEIGGENVTQEALPKLAVELLRRKAFPLFSVTLSRSWTMTSSHILNLQGPKWASEANVKEKRGDILDSVLGDILTNYQEILSKAGDDVTELESAVGRARTLRAFRMEPLASCGQLYTLEELEASANFSHWFTWKELLSNLDNSSGYEAKVCMRREMLSYLKAVVRATQQVGWLQALVFLQAKFAEQTLSFIRRFDKTPDRRALCYHTTVEYFPDLSVAILLRKYVDKKSDSDLARLAEKVREVVSSNVENSWLEEPVRSYLLSRINTTRIDLSYESELLNSSRLVEISEKVYPESADSFLEDVFRLRALATSLMFRRARGWDQLEELRRLHAFRPQAVFIPPRNEIHVFPALLQRPFYRPEVPMYVNFGALGFVLGHEINHIVDTFALNSALDLLREENITSLRDSEELAKRVSCFAQQGADNSSSKSLEALLNDEVAVSEHVADTEGLSAALLAYRVWRDETTSQEQKLPGLTEWTSEQLFFVSFAQLFCHVTTNSVLTNKLAEFQHTAHRFRVENSIRNNEEFSSTFGCSSGLVLDGDIGSGAVPDISTYSDKQCRLWG